jgi:hypothetical protein
MTFSGPAVIEFPDTTLVLHSGEDASVDGRGTVAITLISVTRKRPLGKTENP